MSDIILGVGTTVFASLATLVLVYRRTFLRERRDALTQTLTGFSLLTVGMLVEFLHSLGLGGVFDPLNDSLLRMILTSIPLLAGTLFLVAGLAAIIPDLLLSSRRLARVDRLLEAALVPGDYSAAGSSLSVLHDAVRHVCSVLSPSRFVFLSWDSRNHTLTPVSAAHARADLCTLTEFDLRRLDWLNEVIVNRSTVSRVCAMERDGNLDLLFSDIEQGEAIVAVPVAVQNRLAGVLILVFADQSAISDAEIRAASAALNAAAADAESRNFLRQATRLASIKDVHSRLMSSAVESQDLADFTIHFGEMVRAFIPFDLLCVCVLDDSGSNMKRYSVMESGHRVYERGLSLPASDTAVLRIAQASKAEIAAKLDSVRFRDDSWLSRCGFSSRLSVPVTVSGRSKCVVSFVSVSSDFYDETNLQNAGRVSDAFSVAIELATMRDKLAARTSQITGFWDTLAGLMEGGDTKKYLLSLPRKMTSLMPVTCCSLFEVDSEHGNLVRIAGYSRTTTDQDGQPASVISTGKIPTIQSVIEDGNARVINLADPEYRGAETELELCFRVPVRSAIIVPVYAAGKPRALLALGEKRAWSRRSFSRGDLAIAGIAGSQISLSIVFDESAERSASRNRSAATQSVGRDYGDAYMQFNRRLASPLSSILGAAELLERNLPNTEGPMIDCVRTIRRNTNRAVKTLSDIREFARSVADIDGTSK